MGMSITSYFRMQGETTLWYKLLRDCVGTEDLSELKRRRTTTGMTHMQLRLI